MTERASLECYMEAMSSVYLVGGIKGNRKRVKNETKSMSNSIDCERPHHVCRLVRRSVCWGFHKRTVGEGIEKSLMVLCSSTYL